MSSLAYLGLEIGTLALFVLTMWHAWRRGRMPLVELLTAAFYGVLLEWANILLFRTYHYSDDFWVAIGPVPITIGLCWGMIIYSAMAYSDQLGLPRTIAPFADAVWAIVLDLAFDAVAIRLKLWTWTIPMSAGYFGVPADNFFAWLFVALTFSAYTRWVRRRQIGVQTGLQVFAPLVAFSGLWLSIKFFGVLAAIVYRGQMAPGGGMPIFLITLALCAGIVGWWMARFGVRAQRGVDLIPTLTRWAMHGYFLGWAMLLALIPALRLPGMDMPVMLIVVALVLLMIEVVMLVPLLHPTQRWLRQIRVAPPPDTVLSRQQTRYVQRRRQADRAEWRG